MNKLFFRVTFTALLVVAALYGTAPSAKAQSGPGPKFPSPEGLELELPSKARSGFGAVADLTPFPFPELLTPKAQSGSGLKSGSGLEIDNPRKVEVAVLIESLDDDAKEAGLSESLILAKVNLRLRQNGLTPVNREKEREQEGFLHVNIAVVNNAWYMSVFFYRIVFYYSNNQLITKLAPTWVKESMRTFGRDANFILNKLENHIDVFIDAYLNANNL
ncbi:MAG: hypothetical protein OXU50_08375 [Gammaproteobacteria bacterium]|nr:hypothetical protein [Gammaproteobacteria bacterium]